MTSYTGSCVCGETTWTVTLEKEQANTILCHCNTCKKLSGGAYTLNQIIPSEAFKFTKGGDAIKKFSYKGDSGNDVECYYCPSCTSHPYHKQTVMPDKIILRTVLLDEGKEFDAAAEIYGKDKMSWEKEVATTFPVLPPQ